MLETSRVTTSEIAYKRLLDIRKIWPGQPEYVYAFANYLASYATIDFDASTFILDAAICLDEWLTIRRPFDLSIDYNSVVYLPAQIGKKIFARQFVQIDTKAGITFLFRPEE